MLIGGDFDNKAKQVLEVLSSLSKNDTEVKVSVEDLKERLGLDKRELKNLLEYLEGKKLIIIATIGGPLLYGHIKITEAGILKASNFE